MIFGGVLFGIVLGATVVTAMINDPLGTIETFKTIITTIQDVAGVVGELR